MDFSQHSATIPPVRLELKAVAKAVHVRYANTLKTNDGYCVSLSESYSTKVWYTPLIGENLGKAAGTKIPCDFYMKHGYWQLLFHADSQEFQSFVTPDGIFTLARVLHRNLNAKSHLHAGFMSKMNPDCRKERLIICVDGLAIAATDVNELLKYIAKRFDFCVEVNFALHPLKFHLFKNSITWCGRKKPAEGVRFYPRHISGLENMAIPTMASELLQFTSAI